MVTKSSLQKIIVAFERSSLTLKNVDSGPIQQKPEKMTKKTEKLHHFWVKKHQSMKRSLTLI